MQTIKKLDLTKVGVSYNYCRICGYQPQTQLDEPTYGPIRFWEPDDGWLIGTLCRHCAGEYATRQPKPDDFAYAEHFGDVATSIDTDEDPMEAITFTPETEGILARMVREKAEQKAAEEGRRVALAAQGKKAITLRKSEKKAILQRKDDYDVLFYGEAWGNITFNMTGYTGYLPAPKKDVDQGEDPWTLLVIGECSLSAYRQEITALNREWKIYYEDKTRIPNNH